MRRAILVLAGTAALASAFTAPLPIVRGGIASLKMTQAAPAPGPNFESPKAKLNALAANEEQWGIPVTAMTTAVASSSSQKVDKKWIARPKSEGMFPNNLLAKIDNTGVLKERGSWSPASAKNAKGSATWIAISLCLVLQATTAGTYQMNQDGSIMRGEPISRVPQEMKELLTPEQKWARDVVMRMH